MSELKRLSKAQHKRHDHNGEKRSIVKLEEAKYLGEMCPKCDKARLLHPQVYVYVCPYCRFSYQVNPVDRKKPITIISKSRFEK